MSASSSSPQRPARRHRFNSNHDTSHRSRASTAAPTAGYRVSSIDSDSDVSTATATGYSTAPSSVLCDTDRIPMGRLWRRVERRPSRRPGSIEFDVKRSRSVLSSFRYATLRTRAYASRASELDYRKRDVVRSNRLTAESSGGWTLEVDGLPSSGCTVEGSTSGRRCSTGT